MRVGRAALDEDAIRLLEECNPDVEFDWTRMLKSPPEPAPDLQTPPARSARRQEDTPRRPVPRPQPPAAREETAPAPIAAPSEIGDADAASENGRVEASTAALARLGPEGLLRLRGRHAELMTRISQRLSDPAQQRELKSRAERLNPDTWVTDEEVTAGLDAYEATFEEIRTVVGRPRTRRRRRRGSGAEAPGVNAEGTATGEPSGGAEPGDFAEGEEGRN